MFWTITIGSGSFSSGWNDPQQCKNLSYLRSNTICISVTVNWNLNLIHGVRIDRIAFLYSCVLFWNNIVNWLLCKITIPITFANRRPYRRQNIIELKSFKYVYALLLKEQLPEFLSVIISPSYLYWSITLLLNGCFGKELCSVVLRTTSRFLCARRCFGFVCFSRESFKIHVLCFGETIPALSA